MITRRSALAGILAAAGGLLAGFLGAGKAAAWARPLFERRLCGRVGDDGEVILGPYRTMKDVLSAPGLRIQGGSVFLRPGATAEDAYAALRAAVPPVDPGYQRAYFRAGVAEGQLAWRVFDVPARG